MLAGLFTAMLPGINGNSGSAATVRGAEPRGEMPRTDSLLDRPLGVILTVLNNEDDGPGSLRRTSGQAAAGDVIVFAPSVRGTILLRGQILITHSQTIQGPGANLLAITSRENYGRVFEIQSPTVAPAIVAISGLTVQNGTGPQGSGIRNSGGSNLTLVDVAVINNGVLGTPGGGIFNDSDAQLTMNRVLVANNVGTDAGGLEMRNGASLTNVTFFGNRGQYGAILHPGLLGPATTAASMLNMTITQNTATIPSQGGGITWGNADPLTVRNTILANNQPRNCVGPLTSQGNNLEDTNTCGFNQPGDLPGTPTGLDPAGLQDNGGPTQTVKILQTSAAFNGVTVGICPPAATDQRAIVRPQGPRCDIGAVELALPTGDINGDGIVDVRDYGIWRQNFGQTNCGNPADLDGNCVVDIRDYAIWRQSFGQVAAAPSQPGAGSPAQAR
jgi:hypothetical protein